MIKITTKEVQHVSALLGRKVSAGEQIVWTKADQLRALQHAPEESLTWLCAQYVLPVFPMNNEKLHIKGVPTLQGLRFSRCNVHFAQGARLHNCSIKDSTLEVRNERLLASGLLDLRGCELLHTSLLGTGALTVVHTTLAYCTVTAWAGPWVVQESSLHGIEVRRLVAGNDSYIQRSTLVGAQFKEMMLEGAFIIRGCDLSHSTLHNISGRLRVEECDQTRASIRYNEGASIRPHHRGIDEPERT